MAKRVTSDRPSLIAREVKIRNYKAGRPDFEKGRFVSMETALNETPPGA